MRMNLIHSILVFRENKYCSHHSASEFNSFYTNFFKKKPVKKKSHVNSASELHFSREQCSIYTVHAIALFSEQCNSMHSKEKAAFCCCVGPMYNKVCISFYQSDANCVLIKTQPQPRSQTGSTS
jgi:hypothetical protein